MDEAYDEWIDYCAAVGFPEHEISQTVLSRTTLCRRAGSKPPQIPTPAVRPAPRRGLWRILEMIFGKAAALLMILVVSTWSASVRADQEPETGAIDKIGSIAPGDSDALEAPGSMWGSGVDALPLIEEIQQQPDTGQRPPDSDHPARIGSARVFAFACLAAALACGLMLVIWWRLETRIVRLHWAFLSFADGLPASSRLMGLGAYKAPKEDGVSVSLGTIFSRQQLMAHLAVMASRCGKCRVMMPSKPWSLGLSSSTGPVRERNEDYGIAFRLVGRGPDVDVVVLADGLGGAKHGAEAAFVAVRAASEAVIRRLSASIRRDRDDLRAAVTHSFEAAAAAVRLAAESNGLAEEGCFQTTLIVVSASKQNVAWAHIGDGLGVLVGATSDPHHWLVPQKADPSRPNVLSACLGPRLLGNPRIGTLNRSKGDLIVVGTDGVADFVSPEFPNEVARCAADRAGSLESTSQAVIEMMAGQSDEDGPLCSDNLTIGLLGSGEPPRLTETGRMAFEAMIG